MFNRLSTVLQSAADALAPPPPPLEDLKYHWKLVMRFYAQRTIQSKCPIEETNIPSHLEQLLKILIAENGSTKTVEVDGPCTTAGPCLEFLLQHRLLELLVSLARADSPPGMRRYLLGYLRRLVVAISPHLLTLASIHLPLLRIITLCSQSKASPTEAEEIEFLLTLCQIVHRHPYLSVIFNKETKSCGQAVVGGSESGSKIPADCYPAAEMLQSPSKIQLPSDLNGTVSSGSSENDMNDIKTSSAIGIENMHNRLDKHNENLENCSSNNYGVDGKNVAESSAKEINSAILIGSEQGDKPEGNENSGTSTGEIVVGENWERNVEKSDEQFSENVIGRHSRTTSGSCTPEPFLSDDFLERENADSRLPLLDAVLGYINSADSETKLHVCEALLMLVSVADKTLSTAIACSSNLGLAMAEKLISSFQEIPADIDPDVFEDIPQNWGPKTSQLWLDHHVFPGSRLIASFISWLNFCDQLSVESPIEVSESVAGAVRALFFEVELESELRMGSARGQHLITNIICVCLRHITSNVLLSELNVWLIGDVAEDAAQNEETSLKQLLLNNCLHSNNHLCLNSMRLFELLLENCDEHVLNGLILRYLRSRAYCDPSQQNKKLIDSWSDEEDAREREDVEKGLSTDTTRLSSRTFAPHNIHKIIDSFLQLLPSSLRSATDYQESGYHQYIAEAQRQYTLNVQICTTMEWGNEASFPSEESVLADASTDSVSPQFNEGPFLRMVFTRLRGLANQPYEMNLQLTALVSRLAMLPHPHLHEFLLNPLLPLVPGTTTLYSTMQDVAREMQAALAAIPNSKKMLVRTRQELLGDQVYDHEIPGETCCLFESVVVLEEFCKELAAIAYVKYHHSS